MDEATVEFLRTEAKKTADGHTGNKERSLVIEGIGSLFGATNKAAMNALNKYMDDLGDKYRRTIKQYEDRKSSHEQTFRQALQDIARQYEQQVRDNIKHIITTHNKVRLNRISKPNYK
jgi:hypothetical protein